MIPLLAATPADDTEGARLHAELDRIIAGAEVSTSFQPIVDMQRAGIIGFEALSRGPSNSPLHSPLVLFDVAARHGRLVELERVVVRLIVARFVELGLPGKLFVNLTADTVIAARERVALLAGELRAIGLPPSRLVIELTETRPALDPQGLLGALDALRAAGFAIALDDLGEGFGSLRRWVETRPQYVKIDRHFIDGIAGDPLKQQLVRSVVDVAASYGASALAEGVEQDDDLRVLWDLGIRLSQGYLIARPTPAPRTTLRPEFEASLIALQTVEPPSPMRAALIGTEPGAGERLARLGHTVTADVDCARVLDMFSRDERLYSLPVLGSDQRPIGLLRSLTVLKRGAERYFREVHGRKPCTELMDPQPLVFDISASLRAMSEALSAVDDRHMVDGFIVTRSGRYHGTGRTSDLIRAVSDLQITTARYANPLTLLPGNVPIDAHIESLLRQRAAFVAVWWDLNHFKAFNDVYGYHAGDEMICLAARAISMHAVPQHDFVGHIGGDDFVSLLLTPDWEARIRATLDTFDREASALFDPAHREAGGYRTRNRQGEEVVHPLVSMSAGVLRVEPATWDGPREIAATMAELKQAAKRIVGSGYFVDRRGGEC